MLAKMLVGISALVIMALGTIHLVCAFFGSKLLPRDPNFLVAIKAISPGISNETTMWKAWVGFNASHSLGAILFGLVFGYLALAHPRLLFESIFLSGVGLAMLTGLFLLGQRYWFSIPFRGTAGSLVCFVAAQVLARI